MVEITSSQQEQKIPEKESFPGIFDYACLSIGKIYT